MLNKFKALFYTLLLMSILIFPVLNNVIVEYSMRFNDLRQFISLMLVGLIASISVMVYLKLYSELTNETHKINFFILFISSEIGFAITYAIIKFVM